MAKKLLYFILILSCGFLGACNTSEPLNPKRPVTLTIWHNYGGQMKTSMDQMIDKFNETVGIEKGIILSVTSISGSATLHEKLIMAANGDPGAPELPDITTANPKTALLLAEKGILTDLGRYFSPDELSAYVTPFIQEGRLADDTLFVFPTAKSTEVLFVNKTLFNRFANETDISFEDLRTFEGIVKAAAKYYQWTDNQTPEILNDGKTFFMADSLFNMALIGYQQLEDDFLLHNQLNLTSPVFTRVWDAYFEPAVLGHFAIFDGYASDLAKTGDVICTLGSTAGILFFPPVVTYSTNTTEPVEYAILPYPLFEGGQKIALQRGGGMCVIKSTEEKEYAASVFLKWFTEPEQNLAFISSTGYLPVTQKAFKEIMNNGATYASDPNIQKLLEVTVEMQKEYDFYIPPIFNDYDKLQKEYETNLKAFALEWKKEYEKHGSYIDYASGINTFINKW